MRKIKRPDESAADTFALCISTINDRTLKTRLQNVAPNIVSADQIFQNAAIAKNYQGIFPDSTVGGFVSKDEMVSLYEQKMAKKGAPARKVYDHIKSLSSKCPFCAQRGRDTLDHFLPKSLFPALAVAPLNLVPACWSCNHSKGISQNGTPFLHPYFDDLGTARWLQANVVQTQPAVLIFRVEPPQSWDAELQERMYNQFGVLGLSELYATEAGERLCEIRNKLAKLYAVGGANEVRNYLNEEAQTRLQDQPNGWSGVAYEAWAASDWFCDNGFLQEG